MGKERDIQTGILNALSRGPVRLFRQNVGRAWTGDEVILAPGGRSAVIINPRPLNAGLVNGSGDLIGWRKVRITEEMVGQEVAVFTSIEVKSATGRMSADQKNWAKAVGAAGGIAGVARSVDEARSILMLDEG